MDRITFILNSAVNRVPVVLDKSVNRIKLYITHFVDTVYMMFVHLGKSMTNIAIYMDLNVKFILSTLSYSFASVNYVIRSIFSGMSISDTICSFTFWLETSFQSMCYRNDIITIEYRLDIMAGNISYNHLVAKFKYIYPILLSDYTFLIGNQDMTLSDWCYTEL